MSTFKNTKNLAIKHFRLHVQLFDGHKYREVADSGPIVWHQQAVEISLRGQQIARLRLVFLPDNLRIDWVGVGFDSGGNYRARTVAASEISDPDGPRNEFRSLIRKGDHKFLVTYPGQSYRLEYSVAPVPKGMRRRYFLKSRGYYIEWLRKKWLVQNPYTGSFVRFALNDETIKKTAQLWLNQKAAYQKSFFESKIWLRLAQ